MPSCEVCGEELPALGAGYNAGTCWWNAQAAHGRLRETKPCRYAEGWAVRERDGKLEVLEHGWVDVDGTPHDVTPHNHALKYFSGFLTDDPAGEAARRGIGSTPMCRDLTRQPTDAEPNDHYDAVIANAYEKAREEAEAYCRENQPKV